MGNEMFPNFMGEVFGPVCSMFTHPVTTPCGEPAVMHIFWTLDMHSLACETHLKQADRFVYYAKHAYSEPCGSENSYYDEDENVCKFLDDYDPQRTEKKELVMV